MAPSQFFSLEQIEQSAFKLLCEYVQTCCSSTTLVPPISVERIAEDLLDLGVLWDAIPETDGQVILAKLIPHERLVVFNETRQTLFDETEFLYNTTLAHEVGHWILHMERGQWRRQPSLFEAFEVEEPEFVVYRSSSRASWDEKNAHRFMGCLLMPRHLLVEAVALAPVTSFSDLYRLRDQFEVTVTALTIRLEELNLVYVDADGKFYPNREASCGQTALW